MFNKQSLTLAFVACGVLVAGQQVSNPQIDEAVQKYILEHPELILKSLTTYQAKLKQLTQDRARQTVIAERENLVNDPTSPSAGNAKGVTIVEFFDYRCGYCKKVSPALAKLLETDPSARVVFKELPILGPDSMVAAKASLAADKQGAYLKFHDALFAASEPFTMELMEKIAAGFGLDVARFKTDMISPEIDRIIIKNAQLAEKLQVKATPTFIVGSETVAGALDVEGLRSLVNGATQ